MGIERWGGGASHGIEMGDERQRQCYASACYVHAMLVPNALHFACATIMVVVVFYLVMHALLRIVEIACNWRLPFVLGTGFLSRSWVVRTILCQALGPFL